MSFGFPRRASVTLLVAGGLTAALAASTVGATAPGAGKLVFATNWDGVSNRLEIAVVNPDGSAFHPLTRHEPTGYLLHWTPGGRHLIFESDDRFTGRVGFWRMRRDGRRFQPIAGEHDDLPSPSGRLVARQGDRGIEILTAKGRRVRLLRLHPPAPYEIGDRVFWSPDGRFVAFQRSGDRLDRIFVARVDGRAPVRAITPRKPGFAGYLWSWSPDNRRLLVDVGQSNKVSVLDSIARDGSGRRRIANGVNPSGNHAWAPDGRTIAYVGKTGGIFAVSARGGRARRITATSARGKQAGSVSLAWSPRNSALVYSDKGGLYVIGRSGRGRHRISTSGSHPEWSPTDRTIAFDGVDGSVYSVQSSGAGLKRLTDSEQDDSPEWSPDGSQIAFMRGSPGFGDPDHLGVFVMDAAGRGLRRLGTGYNPHWAPDGRRLVFVRWLHLDPPETTTLGRGAITVVTADGKGSTQVAVGSNPSWSPDGTKLAFMRYFFGKAERGGGTVVYGSSLYVIGADGSGEREIAHRDWAEGAFAYYTPKWSPDGSTIAVVTSSWDTDGSGIDLVDPNTGNVRTLLDPFDPLLDSDQIAWSADAKRLAVTGLYTLGVINADGTGGRILLTNNNGSYGDAIWSPDGTALAYIGCVQLPPYGNLENCDVFTVRADGTNPKQLTRTLGVEGALHWSGSPPGQ